MAKKTSIRTKVEKAMREGVVKTSSQSMSGKSSMSSKIRRRLAEEKFGYSSLQSDLSALAGRISSYEGWSDEQAIGDTRRSVEDMHSRLSGYQKYKSDYGVEDGVDTEALLSGYQSIIDNWDTYAGYYGGYKTQGAFDANMQKDRLAEEFKGLTYDQVQEKKEQYGEDSAEYAFLDKYTGYTDLTDFDKALAGISTGGGKRRGEKMVGGTDDVRDYYRELETARNAYELDHATDRYKHLASEEDFAEQSGYVSTVEEKPMAFGMTDTVMDRTYEFINNQGDIREKLLAEHDQTQSAAPIYTPSSYVERGLHMMNEEEVGYYNYLYATEGKEAAEKYLDDIKVMLNKRATDSQAQEMEKAADESVLNSALMSLVSIPMNVGSGFYSAPETISELLTGEVNPFSTNDALSNASAAIRKSVGENIEESATGLFGKEFLGQNVGRFLYDTSMSIGDSMLGVTSLGKGFTPLMGMNAFQQKAKELTEAGESEDKILATAAASGIAEAVFEYISIDNLIKIKDTDSLKRVVTNALSQAGIEASEEVFTEIANIMSDTLIREDSSELKTRYEALLDKGYTEADAMANIAMQMGEQIAAAGFGGALSGGVTGSVFSGVDYHGYKQDKKETEMMQRFLDEAKKVPEEAGKEIVKEKTSDAPVKDTAIEAAVEGMDEDKKALILSMYDGQSDAKAFAESVDLAYSYGEMAYGEDTALKNRGVLTPTQAAKVYGHAMVRKSREVRKAHQEKVAQITKKQGSTLSYRGSVDDSVIDYDSKTTDGSRVNWNELTMRQRGAVELVKAFGEATGVNIKFIQSEVKNGRRVGKNGSYNADTNTMEVDVYAGVIDSSVVQDSIIPTVSHELTHWMKDKAPEMYRAMQNHIMDALTVRTGTTADALIQSEMARIKKAHPDMDVTEEAAVDEFVARACEDMFAGSTSVREILSQVKEDERKSFVDKVKEVFKNLLDWVNELLGQYESQSAEAKLLREYGDSIAKLQKMWDKALEEAVEVNQGANVVKAEGEQMPAASTRYSTRESFQKHIEQWAEEGRPDRELFILGSTGDILQGLGAIESDIYMLGDKINTILEEHPEMTLEEIEKIPQILESPVLILKSKGKRPKVVMFGSLKAKNGKPILTVLDLRPTENGFALDDMQKVSSAYTKTATHKLTAEENGMEFVRSSEILYVKNKKTTNLLSTIGFYMPITCTHSGFIGSITYEGDKIKIEGKSFDEVFSVVEKDAEHFSDREIRPLASEDYDVLKSHFGTTSNFNVAGYMLQDGTMLDFSGKHWGNPSTSRDVDHRDVWEVWENPEVDGTGEMINMISNGNIRLSPESGGVALAVSPTVAQRKVLERYINHFKGEVIVDIDRVGGDTEKSFEYERGTPAKKIFDDIDNYLRGGRQSDLMAFHTKYSDRDSEGNLLTEGQQEYFKDSQVRDDDGNLLVVYHGTRKADFTVFKRNVIYFTDSKGMAGSYSPNGEGFEGYLNITNPLVIDAGGERWSRIPIDSEMKAFLESAGASVFKEGGKWRTTPADIAYAVEDGIDEGELDYDGIIIRNVDDTGSRGNDNYVATDFIVFNSNQFKRKDNANPTDDKDMRFSDRETQTLFELMGEKSRLEKENTRLKDDVSRLKKRLALEKKLTGKNGFNERQLLDVAKHIKELAGSDYSTDALKEDLREIYTYIVTAKDVKWDALMGKCHEVAGRLVERQKKVAIVDEYMQYILKDLRSKKISLSEEQIQEAKSAYGERYRDAFMGKIVLSKNGISLDQQWQEWANMYPDLFNAEVTGGDQIIELLDIYDAVKEGSVMYERFNAEELVRELASEIYNQYWNISPVVTVEKQHQEEIKRINYEHRQAMSTLRKEYKQRVADQKKSDKAHYAEVISNIKQKHERDLQEAKEQGDKKLAEYKERRVKNAKIKHITREAMTLNDWLKKNSKDAHIPELMKKPVIYLLNAIDFSSKQLLGQSGGQRASTPTQKDISMSKALEQVHEMISDITSWQIGESDVEEVYGTFVDFPPGFEKDVRDLSKSVNDIMRLVGDNEFVLNNMSIEELERLEKIVVTIKGTAIKMNKFLTVRHAEGVANLSQQDMLYNDALGEERKRGEKSPVGKMLKMINWGNALPYYAFKRFGAGGELVYEALQDGWDKFAFHVKEIVDYAKSTYTDKEVKECRSTVHEFKVLMPAKDIEKADPNYKPKYQMVKMTVPQIMSLYCLEKRSQARGHIVGGGLRPSDFTIGRKTVSQTAGFILTETDLKNILGVLTPRQRQVADALQRFMNTTCSEWGNVVSMARFGYNAFEEENYFPLKSDPNNHATDDAVEHNNSLFRLLNMSFTKAITPKANSRIIIGDIFDVFVQHTSDMAKYNGLALPVLDAFKWYNYKEKEMKGETQFKTTSLKQSIENAYGKDAMNYITTFLRDINGEHSAGRDVIGKGFFTNAKIASVGFNMRVVALQPTSYFRAAAVLDNRYLVAAMGSKPKIDRAEKYCGIALWKSMGFFDINVQNGVADLIKHEASVKDKVVEASMKGAEWADKMTWGYLWNACELEVRDKHKELKAGTEEFYEEVGKRLRDVIYATQVVDSTMTRSHMMRSKDGWDKMATSFLSEPTLSFNMLQSCYFDWKMTQRQTGSAEKAFKMHGKKMARTFMAYTVTNAMAAMVEAAFDIFRDEDEELNTESFVKLFVENFKADMSVAGKIPYIKEMVSMMQGYSSSRLDTQWMQYFVNSANQFAKVAAGEGSLYKAVKNGMRALSAMFGLPMYNVMRDAGAVYNVVTGESAEEMFDDTIGEIYPSLRF
ncbi:MAG: hypothetical protein E7287_05135 [Lachnospiraceae bacterium]|nr:hypothetical protein [Lachnospiraceae bacterium]